MDNLEKIKRHLAKPVPITIKNGSGEEDTFYFKPLNVEQQAILMELSKRMQNRENVIIDGKELPDIAKEDMTELLELLLDVVKASLPELDEITMCDFVNTNFEQLSDALMELVPKDSNREALAKIKKRQEMLRDGSKTSEPAK